VDEHAAMVSPRANRLQNARIAVFGGIDGMAYHVVASLGGAGLHVEVLLPDPHSRLRLSRYCRALHAVPAPVGGRFPPGTIDVLREVIAASRIDVVVASDYDALIWLSDHADLLAPAVAFPAPSRAQIERCNDKWQLAELCATLGIDHPETRLLESPDDAAAVASWGRVIVKPRSECFGFGVYELASGADVRDHLVRGDRPGNALPLLVQEFVPGQDIDVTVLAHRGRTVTGIAQERLADGGSLRFSTAPELLAPAEQLAAAVGFDGVMDFDLRRDPATGRVAVIECNPRLPGSIPNKTWAGVNLPVLGVELALGLLPHRPDIRLPAVYRPPWLRYLPLVARPSFWFGELYPTRTGWLSRARDPRYACTITYERLIASRRNRASGAARS
jgi:hypothetical protein